MHSGGEFVYNMTENVMDTSSYVIKPLSRVGSNFSSPK